MSQSVQNSKKCFKEIYKFFYDYLKLYKLASSSRVSCWKQTDLRNALSWSSACEELTSKLAEKVHFYDVVLLGEIDAILNYLQIECPKNQVVKKLIEEASIEMERVRTAHRSFILAPQWRQSLFFIHSQTIFDNASLSDELKSDLVSLLHNELYESV